MSGEFNSVVLIWPILVVVAGVIVWSIRQEGEINLNKTAIKNLQNWFSSDLENLKKETKEMKTELSQQIKDLKEDMDATLRNQSELTHELNSKLHHIEVTLARVEGRLARGDGKGET